MSISSRFVRAVRVTYARPMSSKPSPTGSEMSPSGAHSVSLNAGFTSADTAARPAADSLAAESAEKRTTVGVKAGTDSTTSGRIATGAATGSGAGVAWHEARTANTATRATCDGWRGFAGAV